MKPEDRVPDDESIEFSNRTETQLQPHSDEELKKWAGIFKVGRNDGTQRPR